MFGEMPAHIRKRHQRDVPSIGALDDLRLPGAPVHYADPEILSPSRTREAVLDNSAKLDDLTQKALALYDAVLSEPMDSDPKTLAVQMEAARTILQTQLRVDDSRLKKRTTDTLAQLLSRMDAEDAKLINA